VTTKKKRRIVLALALLGLVWFGYWRGYVLPTTGTAKSNKLSFRLSLQNGPDKRELRFSFDRTKGTVIVTRTGTTEVLVFEGATVQSIDRNIATTLTRAPVQAAGLEALRTIVNVPASSSRELSRSERGVIVDFMDFTSDTQLANPRNTIKRVPSSLTVARDLDLNALQRPKVTVINTETRPSSLFFTDRIAA
jgi:hypothetical protein